MNNARGGDQQGGSPYCYFHPKDFVVGVCAACLRERLLFLASKQGDLRLNSEERRPHRALRRKPTIALPKVFALGSFLQRLDSSRRPNRRAAAADPDPDDVSIASLEDSFISIKFEDDGKARWDGKKAMAMAAEAEKVAGAKAAVVEHAKRGGVLRWRKQVVGRLLQLARWKRAPGKAAGHIDGKAELGKAGKRGWIRSLTTRRRTGAW